jgi:hypothetical protein
VIALSSQVFALNDDFSIALIWPKIDARAAPEPAFALSRVDLHRIERRKWPLRTRQSPVKTGLLQRGTGACDIAVGKFDRGAQ